MNQNFLMPKILFALNQKTMSKTSSHLIHIFLYHLYLSPSMHVLSLTHTLCVQTLLLFWSFPSLFPILLFFLFMPFPLYISFLLGVFVVVFILVIFVRFDIVLFDVAVFVVVILQQMHQTKRPKP